MKKLLKAFNKLVFIKPRTEEEVFDIKSLSEEIQKDFILTTHWFALIDEFVEECVEGLLKPKFKSSILSCMWIAQEVGRPGRGFTPRLSTIEDEETLGYNCLAKAAVLGTCLKESKYKFKVLLGITPDHAMVLIKLRGSLYLCDTAAMKLRKLNGTFVNHNGYTWYTRAKEDWFMANHIVIQKFDEGIVNAIVESFIFLKENKINQFSGSDLESLAFKHPRFKLNTIVNQVDWRSIQRQYFSDLNEYKDRYRKEYLIEGVFVEGKRYWQRIRRQFDIIVMNAYEKAVRRIYSPEANKLFIDEHTPLLQKLGERTLSFLEGKEYQLELPKPLETYLKVIRDESSKVPEVQDFVLQRFKHRLSMEISFS